MSLMGRNLSKTKSFQKSLTKRTGNSRKQGYGSAVSAVNAQRSSKVSSCKNSEGAAIAQSTNKLAVFFTVLVAAVLALSLAMPSAAYADEGKGPWEFISGLFNPTSENDTSTSGNGSHDVDQSTIKEWENHIGFSTENVGRI